MTQDAAYQSEYDPNDQWTPMHIGDINTFLAEKDLENFKQLESSQKNQKNIKKDKIQKRLSYNEQRKQERSIKKLKNHSIHFLS